MTYQEIQWKEEFNIGAAVVDDAHKQLFAIVHRLLKLTEQKDKSRFACEESIKFLKNYAVRHFAQEEAYMQSVSYPRIEMHRRIHENFRDKAIPALEQELARTEFSDESVRLFTGICIGWLTGHIMMEDRAITGRVQSKWSDEQSVEMLTRLEHTVEEAAECILGVKTQIISEHYVGENLEKPVIFQKRVKAVDGGWFRIILAFEESLLLQTTGRMLGMFFDYLDGLVLSAASEMANAITNHVGSLFGLSAQQLMNAVENRLSDRQLKAQFGTRFPLYSLLFDAEIGRLVFCLDKEETGDNVQPEISEDEGLQEA